MPAIAGAKTSGRPVTSCRPGLSLPSAWSRGSRLLPARFVITRSAGLARTAPFFPVLVKYRCSLPEHRVPVTLANQRKGGALRMTDLRLDGPVTILVLLGLTLPEVSE